ncbi:hypothetical protein SD72_02500 [Leucobacter komagatae]|uniref:HipA-like C-terminal domain-containing protein n=1 Tax=Leucobacter komagatae TaxID=55969 RepID=A0A0D0H8R2_9MICO|nr:hypothetical protein SD72_02500 [Leucobacter komagatae]
MLHADSQGISQETAFTSLALEDQVAARIADIKQTGEPFSTAEGSPLPRFSLAGAQAKFALSITDSGELFWSDSATPSTHIIKPESAAHSGLELVEAATLALARRVGIFAPAATQFSFLGETAFMIQRFDRAPSPGTETVARLHVEDMAQALGPQAADKYQVDAAEIVDLLRRHNGEDTEAYAFFAQYVFNTLIGNADAHAKNYSIMHQQGGNVTVSPLYDAIPIGFFPGYDQDLSMPVADENRAGAVRQEHWLVTAREIGLDADHVLAILRATAEGILEHLDATLGEVEHSRVTVERLDSLRRNAERQLRAQ